MRISLTISKIINSENAVVKIKILSVIKSVFNIVLKTMWKILITYLYCVTPLHYFKYKKTFNIM